MKYKYRCVSRFPVLLMIGDDLLTIRPNQVIEIDERVDYSLLKEIVEKAPVKRKYKPRANKKVNKDGNNNKT